MGVHHQSITCRDLLSMVKRTRTCPSASDNEGCTANQVDFLGKGSEDFTEQMIEQCKFHKRLWDLTYARRLEQNTVLNRLVLVNKSLNEMLTRTTGVWVGQPQRCVVIRGNSEITPQAWWRRIWYRAPTDARLVSLAAGCPDITDLDLSHGRITDTGLTSLASGCSAITSLDLTGCDQITDAGLASLAAGCRAITIMDLTFCDQVTDKGLASLAAGCSAITTLCLCGCYEITDTGLASLAAGCPNITTLRLEDCEQITDAGLARLAAGCPNITDLWLAGCDNVTTRNII